MAWVQRDQVATLLSSLIGQLSYSVSLQRAFLFLPQIPISSLPGALAWHKGTEMQVRLQPTVRAGRGRQVSRQQQPAGLQSGGHLHQAPVSRAAPWDLCRIPSPVSSPPVFQKRHGAWQQLSARWLWLH